MNKKVLLIIISEIMAKVPVNFMDYFVAHSSITGFVVLNGQLLEGAQDNWTPFPLFKDSVEDVLGLICDLHNSMVTELKL